MPNPEKRIDFSFYSLLAGMILLMGILPVLLPAAGEKISLTLRLLLGAYPLQIFYIFIALYGAKKFSPETPVLQTLDLKMPEKKFLMQTIIITPVLYLLLAWVTAIFVFLLKKTGFATAPQDAVLLIKNCSPETLPVLIGAALLAAPLGEELAFRHIIHRKFCSIFPENTATVLTAFFFAAVHLNLQSFPALFLLGIYLSYLRSKSSSLWTSISAHALFNAVTVTALLLMRWGVLTLPAGN